MEHSALPKLALRLDLAEEATAALRGAANIEIQGVREDVTSQDGIELHTVTVLNEQGAAAIGRPPGRYLTFRIPPLTDGTVFSHAAEQLAKALESLLLPLKDGLLLVAGLGNYAAVADSLGPRVVQRTYATRAAFLSGENPEGLGHVCCIAPGVLGASGIESSSVLHGLCDELHPAALLAVDALAAASIARVGTTIQLSETGIRPGSGVENNRGSINAAACGCPVIALGVPTIVDTSSIISETMSALGSYWQQQGLTTLPPLSEDAREHTEDKLLNVFNGQLMVTPKDIDQLVSDMTEVIAAAIAIYAHPACNAKNYRDFIR